MTPIRNITDRERKMQAEIDALRAELAVQTQAANHWMSEACRDHNALMKLKEQEPVALLCGNGGSVYFPTDAMFHYWIGRNCTKFYLAAGAQKEQS